MSIFFQPALGFIILISTCYLFSSNRKQIAWGSVIKCLSLFFFLAIIMTHVTLIERVISHIALAANALKEATTEGTKFVFGYIGGGDAPFEIPEHLKENNFIIAFQAFPIIIVVGAITMLLFYWKVIPFFMRIVSPFFKHSMGVGGAIGIVSTAKIFLGHLETGLFVKPYLRYFTNTETLILLALGFGTTSIVIIPIYSSLISNLIPNPMPIFIITNIITIPLIIGLGKILEPNTQQTAAIVNTPYNFTGSLDALNRGTRDGLTIFMNIVAMMIVMAALITLCNKFLSLLPFTRTLSLQYMLGYFFKPIAWLMGIPWHDAHQAGELLATKTVLNEIFAYIDLSKSGAAFSTKTRIILASSFSSFANFASIGVTVSGFSAICPEKKRDLSSLSMRAFLIGVVATCVSGALLGILLA